MKPARVYEGVWVDMFEGQGFVENARSAADVPRGERPRLEIDRLRTLRVFLDRRTPDARLPDPYEPHLYRIRFMGAEARDMRCRQDRFGCYGHLNAASGLIVVRRVLALEPLGPPAWVSSDNRR